MPSFSTLNPLCLMSGKIEPRPELKLLGVTKRAGCGSLTTADLAVTTGWGHAGKGGVTMPGKGKVVEREYSPAERKATLEDSEALGLTEEQALAILGCKTLDVYLNDVAYGRTFLRRSGTTPSAATK
ncbi:MAG: hypothetical protein ABR953_14525 [Candidatus Acidiferrales bacterium]